MKEQKLPLREWISLILIGFAGQLAWAIENNYINLWVYSQTGDSTYITWMTVASAIAATLTTFFMGVLSDKLGSRKFFIAGGYTIWGVSVFLFGLCSHKNMAAMFGASSASIAVGVSMVIMDCLMTFFGSTANDACFNARVTDVTNTKNRGKVESVLSVLPLFATIVVLLLAGAFGANGVPSSEQASDMASQGITSSADYLASKWFIFYLVFGALVTVIGIASFFLLPKDEIKPNKEGKYWANLIYGFRPSVIKNHKDLYISLLSFMAFNLAIDAFMPYYMVYFQNSKDLGGLALSGMGFYVPMGIILIVASIVVILLGAFALDRFGKINFLMPSLGLSALGFLLMFFSTDTWALVISGILMMSGYLTGTAVLGAIVRDETPEKEVGLFQGVRMFFTVLIPMIVGSNVSDAIMKISGGKYTNSIGETVTAPNKWMFIVSMVFMLLAFIPSIYLFLAKKKEAKASPVDTTPKE
jgi:MFS family permease